MKVDFYRIVTSEPDKKGDVKVFPDFRPRDFKDLMIRGGSFYAIWNEEENLWSTDEYDAVRLVDQHVEDFVKTVQVEHIPGAGRVSQQRLDSFASKQWLQFKQFAKSVSDSYSELDTNLTFASTEVSRNDHVSKRLSYDLRDGDISAWDEIVSTLYNEEERRKIEWAIGSIVSGDSKFIQKFLVFYGSPGTGKGTVLNIIEMLFNGYTSTFEARALGQASNAFATAAFKDNPLVAIEQDGNLSRIEDNTKINSIISHEHILINEKNKPAYPMKVNAMLMIGTNLPVRISDAKSGILRRLIDVHPTGNLIPSNRYHNLMERVEFELGAIAQHCLNVYSATGKNYYSAYRPIEMMVQTDYFYNFVMSAHDIFLEQGGVSSEQAWGLFKEFCASEHIETKIPKFKFREELKNYFKGFHQRTTIDGRIVWNWYSEFDTSKFKQQRAMKELPDVGMEFVHDHSIVDKMLADCAAQLAVENREGSFVPEKKWDNVTTTLKDISTNELHYVKPPLNHIVVDFDLKDDDGNKSLERNIERANGFPPTYGEISRGGGGLHLHYLYDGDPTRLMRLFDHDIEVKVFSGGSSLRRKLSKCNNLPVATLSEGSLPIKEPEKVLSDQSIKSEKGLRDLLARNLQKQIHAGTKPSVDFMKHVLDEAYSSGMVYDVSDMQGDIINFALGSTNQSDRALETAMSMQFKSKDIPDDAAVEVEVVDETPVIYDVEVFPNLFIVCWKKVGPEYETVRMVNPSPQEVETLLKMPLVGFYNRQYDNHILYARMLGYDNKALFDLSAKIVSNVKGASFGAAYGLSYADIYDFSTKKQSLKKWQIELGLKHLENSIPWDQDVPEDKIPEVVEYCVNDVETTETVWLELVSDFAVRKFLAKLSGLTPNHTNQQHTAKIIFGDDKRPVEEFVYTDLSTQFPGYIHEFGKSHYRDEVAGEGGYVYAEPGMYENVALLDVASMHPTSIRELNLFGKTYTKRFTDLMDARLAIKHGDFERTQEVLDGRLAPYITQDTDKATLSSLSNGLKLVINTVYGLTSARFENKFKDPRNKDNIVAKRGSLFMIDLKNFVQERGFTVAHIKTDSIKIPHATPEIIEEVTRFGEKYGYTFEHEATYRKFVLVNDAVYVAQKSVPANDPSREEVRGVAEEVPGVEYVRKYEAVGAQFQQPVIYKTLFSGEELTFEDQCETKQVSKGSIYMDFSLGEKPEALTDELRFVGRTGRFTPVKEGTPGAGYIYRYFEEKFYSIAGTKGYFWKESDRFGGDDEIDDAYYQAQIQKAIETIDKFGSYEEFVK